MMDYNTSIAGQNKVTSSWLKQHLGEPEVAGKKHNSRRQTDSKKTRNLSSAGKGTVRSFPANLSYITARPPSSGSAHDVSVPCRRLLGVNSCSKLEELPNGYFSHGDLWMTSKQDTNSNNKSNNGFSREMTNMNIPYRTTTLTRSKSANQRTLGVTRSSYTYKRSPSVESNMADINQWRALTPDYPNTAKHFIFNNVPSNNGGVYSYYGNTRINLEDPAGLFYNSSPNMAFSDPFNLRQPPRTAYEQIKSSRNENLVLMKNARKLASSKGVKKEENNNLVCPIGQPYDYRSDSPRSSSTIKNMDFQSSSNGFVKSADARNRLLSRPLELERSSVLHQYSAFDNQRYSNAESNNSTLMCCDNNAGRSLVGINSNNTSPLTGSVQSLPDIDPLYSSTSSLKSDDSKSIPENESAKNPYYHPVVNDSARNSNYHPVNNDSTKKCYYHPVDSDSEKNTNFRSQDLETKPQYYIPTGNRQSHEDLSVSQLFVLRVDKKQQSPKRSVRFKVRDIVHEYEPWAPVKT